MDGVPHLSGPTDHGVAEPRSRSGKRPVAMPGNRNGTEPAPGSTVTLVVPTRNEAEHVGPFVERVEAALRPFAVDWHVEVIDDSDDDTPGVLAGLVSQGAPLEVTH